MLPLGLTFSDGAAHVQPHRIVSTIQQSLPTCPRTLRLEAVAEKPETKPPGPSAPAKADEPEDVVLIHGRADDGALKILRKKGDELSAGELRPLETGKPIQGDVLKLRPRKEMPLLCDVEEEVKLPSTPRAEKPAKVASDQYRAGWEKLWGRRRARSKPS